MRLVTDTIRQNLENQDTLFIFPSEVAAAFWRRRALTLTQHRAVRADRFISWDTFKEKASVNRREAVPANSFVRLCFAADLLKKNADGEEILNELVLPEFAESWRPFVRTLARMLPSLELLLHDNGVLPLLKPLLRADFELVNRLYKEFLDSHGFFEPLHEKTHPAAARAGIVFYSSVIADFAEFAPFLDPQTITILTEPEAQASALISYPNARIEVKRTCLACRDLLDSGVSPSRIAVTLTRWNGYYEELRDTAALYDVPLLPRVGKPLADYTEVRIYRLINECVATGFSVGALKELFLNTAFPWTDPGKGRALIRFGIDSFGVRNFSAGGARNDEWRRRLRIAGKSELLEFYRRFKRGAESITGAETFAQLRSSVMVFNNRFLDTNDFSEQQSRPFSTALDMLSRLEETAAHLHDLDIDSPFSLWMSSLTERRYVQPARGDGIPVYEYRVAAGINPDHHFILGVSQEASTVKTPRYPFLALNMVPEAIREADDFTESFLHLYENSGQNVIFTSGIEGFDGPATPMERFVSRGTVSEPEMTLADADLYRNEVNYWTGKGDPLKRIHTMQQAGLSSISETGLRAKGQDCTVNAIGHPLLAQRVFDCQVTEEGKLRISPTNLDMWIGCRFRYLLYRGLRLEETEFDTVYSSPLESGILFHSLFSEVLSAVDGIPDVHQKTVIAAKVLTKVFLSWTGPRFLPPILNDLRRRAEEHIQAFLEVDGETFPSARVHTLEDTLQVPSAEDGAVLYGRLDRISALDGSYIVVDYKTRLWKKKAGMVTPDGTLYSFQVPVYLLLVEGIYGPVSEALYYDIHKGEYSSVFGGAKPWFDDSKRVDLLEQTRTAVSLMFKGINASIYTTPEDGCDGCDFRAVCREKYRVRQND
jgi:hypothetical protein